MNEKTINYAKTPEEAEKRYKQYRNLDPFPDTLPALLNSADIQAYVAATGMIFPFNLSDDNFKPASYSINLKGECIYFDVNNKKVTKYLEKEDDFLILESNSIVYVSVEPTFRFPNYIAGRFNLQIKHVHRGLLVGTGPLVDPGFCGNLCIPLHNLTGKSYTMKCGEPLIWMEFTKISKNDFWKEDHEKKGFIGKYVEFEQENYDDTISDYLHRASPNQPIVSSIPLIEAMARKSIKEAKTIQRNFNLSVIISFVGIIIGLVSFIYYVFTIQNSTKNYIDEAEKNQKYRYDKLKDQNDNLKNEVDILKNKIDSIRNMNLKKNNR